MPHRRLTSSEQKDVQKILDRVRSEINDFASNDSELLFATRLMVAQGLSGQERSKPILRRALKTQKREEQNGRCAVCQEPLPEKFAVLGRLDPEGEESIENTRLLCPACDRTVQEEREFEGHLSDS